MIVEFKGIKNPVKTRNYTVKVDHLTEKLEKVLQFDYCKYPVDNTTGLKLNERVPASVIGVTVEEGKSELLDMADFLKAMLDRTANVNSFSSKQAITTTQQGTTGKSTIDVVMESQHSPKSLALWNELKRLYFSSPDNPDDLVEVEDKYLNKENYNHICPGTQFSLIDGTATFMVLEDDELVVLDTKTGAGCLDQFVENLELESELWDVCLDDDIDIVSMTVTTLRNVEPDLDGRIHIDWRLEKLLLGTLDNKESWQFTVENMPYTFFSPIVFYVKEHYFYYNDEMFDAEFAETALKFLVQNELLTNKIKIDYV